MTNYILEYYEKLESGEILTSKKVLKIYKHLVSRIKDDSMSEFEFSEKRANHAIDFIERYCKHSKGKWGGQPIQLQLWQKAFISAVFGFVHKIDGTRQYREVLLIVARKNGKSVLGSAIGLYLQIADNEPGAEIYAVSTKRDAAKIVWLESKRMVNKSPALRKRIKPLVAEMKSDFNDSTFKPLGSDSETLDGLNVHGGLLDEIHAWKDKNLYDVIVDGTTAREQPLILMITTAGTVRESVYDLKYAEAEMLLNGLEDNNGYKDERFLPIIYELDSEKEFVDEKNWIKANPALGVIKSIDQLRTKVNKAIANPMLVRNLLCKDFDVAQTGTEAWFTYEQLNNKESYDLSELKPKYAIGGVDLSSTTDLTSACIAFQVDGDETVYYKHMYWLPEDLLEQRAKEDKVPYDIWRDNELLRTTPGNTVHYKYVTEWFIEMQEQYDIYITWIGYDSWSARYFVDEMANYFGQQAMVPVIQGKKTLSGPMKLLGAKLNAKKINYENNPITKWCLSNTSIEMDKNGNIQPHKGKNQRKRIDGTAAMLNAYVVLQEKEQDYLNMI